MSLHAVEVLVEGRDVHFRVAHGTLTLRPTMAGHQLRDHRVDEAHRRQGRGGALVAAACRWADHNRAVLLCTTPTEEAQQLLHRHGFFEDRGIWWRYPAPPDPATSPELPPPF
ncbi:GNAT family N-acetyltransferase [Micromonospora coxensis]|uniref:GNAT family N-acetyltransferase n=1 Tax=Micromonospora coxensis TaxID=356852 RepID=UPI00344ADDCE